jgi:hypothetical protein
MGKKSLKKFPSYALASQSKSKIHIPIIFTGDKKRKH